jgi:hypothetical protein
MAVSKANGAVTRQAHWQRQRNAQGRCARCGREPLASRTLGRKCLARRRLLERTNGHGKG